MGNNNPPAMDLVTLLFPTTVPLVPTLSSAFSCSPQFTCCQDSAQYKYSKCQEVSRLNQESWMLSAFRIVLRFMRTCIQTLVQQSNTEFSRASAFRLQDQSSERSRAGRNLTSAMLWSALSMQVRPSVSTTPFEDAPREQKIYLKVDPMLHNASLRGQTSACILCC